MNFVWDLKKAESNLKKHGVGFEEASTVFFDPLSMTGADPDHSEGEEWWLTFGASTAGRFLVVSHKDEAEGETIRIISARPGTGPERTMYEEG
jgi:uncharacterized DUF497 family protein